MHQYKKTVIGFILFSLSLGIGLLSGCGAPPGGIEATGTVEMTEINLATKVSGRVMRVLVQEGQQVAAGTLLAELDHEELDSQIAAARANLQLARARYQKANSALGLTNPTSKTGSRQAQIELAQSNLTAAQATLNQTEQDLERAKKLYQEQIISPAEYDQALTRREVAAAQYQAALHQLEVIRTNPNTEDLDLTAQATQSQIAQAESALALLTTALNNTRITAPVAGVISAQLVELGEVVSPGMVLFTLLDYAQPWVKIYLPLKEMERVRLNQPATVKIDAYPTRKFSGRISFIAAEAEFTPKNYLTKEERVKQVFAVKLALDNAQGIFKAGIPVDVRIENTAKNRRD